MYIYIYMYMYIYTDMYINIDIDILTHIKRTGDRERGGVMGHDAHCSVSKPAPERDREKGTERERTRGLGGRARDRASVRKV